MTVTNTSNRIKYSGNGSTTAFSFPNLVFDEDDLVVTLIDSSDVETVQTITTHYTVSGTGVPAGCTVTMVTAPASGEELLIERSMGYLQSSDYTDGGDLPAETLESDLDKSAIRDQQLKDIFDRTLKTPASETESNIGTLPAKTSRASKVFTFDSNGDPLASAFGDINVSIDIVESSPVDGHFLVHDGTNWINEAPATARASMGLGAAAVADTGVANGDVPVMDATGYPAANGSQITSLDPTNVAFTATDRLLGRDTAGAGAGEELTPAAVLAMLGYQSNSSTGSAIPAAGGNVTLTHGFGAVPNSVSVWIRCTTADSPFAVGDAFEVTTHIAIDGTSEFGIGVMVDATEVKVIRGANALNIYNETDGNAFAIDTADWVVDIYARILP